MQPGQTYAHYSILAKIGAGGMGEVFRAQDTKLRRDVAIKVLPAEFAADPARMARFEQEARALAALNHTNISGIFGIEQHQDLRFLVMELAEGEDLSEIIGRGPLPLDEAMDIARQICAGLEDAHGRGIVHRDLKPANIKILPDGTVKILDFGLAKAMVDEPGASSTDIANSPTLMNTMTQPGVLLGTAAYMSPEQARGKPVDWRADIWAFGCVLYEMLCGSQVYGRPTVTDILAAIIEREPDFDLLPPNLPPALTQLLRRTLTKDQRNRLQAIGDARIALQEIQDGDTGSEAATEAPSPGRRLPWLAAILAAIVLTAAGTWWMKGSPPAVTEEPTGGLLRLTLPLPAEYPLNYVGGSALGVEFTALDLSEDGSRLVYLSRTDQFRGLVAIDLATNDHFPLAGTDNAFIPILSPDAKWIAFLADEKVKRVPFTGGGVEVLGSAFDPSDLLWSLDGYLYLISQQGQILTRMKPALGSPVETVLEDCDCRLVEDWTEPGKILLKGDGSYALLEPDGSEKPLDISGNHVRLLDNRIILSAQSGRVVATRVDGKGTGPFPAPQTVLTGVRTAPLTGRGHYATSDNGLLAYVAGPPGDVAQLVRRHPDGREEFLPFDARIYGAMDVLADGSRIAIVVDDATPDNSLEILNLDTGTRQVVGDRTRNSSALWTADGGALCYGTLVDSVYSIVEHPIDSVNPPTVLLSDPALLIPYDISSDNRLILLRNGDASGSMLSVWDRQTGSLTPFARPTSGYLWAATFSPDDRFVAYTKVGDGGSEVYVEPYPATGKRWLVSTGIGEEPVWSQERRELIFRRGQGWYKVTYDDGGDFRPSAPELMFEDRYINIGGMEYRLLADGSMMMLVSANTEETTDHLDFVVNWDQELARMLGAEGD